MKRGHRARECRANVTCSNCGQHSHHVSLCESKDKQLSPNAREFEVLPEREDAKPSALSPSTLHVGSGGRVALQTARAVIRGEADPYRVRVPGGDSHMKQTGMLVVSLRGVNFGFWSRLGCSGQSANILRHQGLV